MTCLYPNCRDEAVYLNIGLCGPHRKMLKDSERSELWGVVNEHHAGRITEAEMRERQRATLERASGRLGIVLG